MSQLEQAVEVEQTQTKYLGFWIYLMTDCILFASVFATYIVLRENTFGGPGGGDLFSLPSVLTQTIILLMSSFVCGLAVLAARARKKALAIFWLVTTFVFGAAFLVLELIEFMQLIAEGNGWQTSAFLSAFFTLVGLHGAHIAVGLLWLVVVMWQIARLGFTDGTTRRLTLFSLFWHFLDIIWICLFTIVYLMGVL